MSPNTGTHPHLIRCKSFEEEPEQETDQPTNMENHQSNEIQSELILSLNCSSRDQLITTLNQLCTALQSNKPINEDTKQQTRKKINDTVLSLVELSPNAFIESNEKTISSQMFIELSRGETAAIVVHLMAIRDALLFSDLINEATKADLITVNKQIIGGLLHKIQEGQCRSDEEANEKIGGSEEINRKGEIVRSDNISRNENISRSEDIDRNENEPKKQMVESERFGACEELDKKWTAALASQKAEQMSSLGTMLDKLRKEMREMSISQTEASFECELAGVSEFIQLAGNKFHSEAFWCKGLQWSIYVLCEKDEYLGVYLYCRSEIPANWSFKTSSFNLILFNRVSEKQNLVLKLNHTFQKKTAFGMPRFICCARLKDETSGFTKNDRILLGVELKIQSVVRK